jgi:hypothetical protein
MIRADMIPDEVVEAAREAWLRSDVNAKEDWRAAIAAALNAWMVSSARRIYPTLGPIRIVLPPPQEENTDA